MTYKNFEDIDIWKDARLLAVEVFKITLESPFKSDYKFRDQIRASSSSIMDNIAEGFERGSNKEFIQFLFIAKGSCGETRSQLYRALDINYIQKESFDNLYAKTISLSNQITGFIGYLKNSENKGYKYH